MEGGIENRYLPLYKAALQGDWITANRIFDDDSSLLTRSLFGLLQESALHVAIGGGCSIEFVRKLVYKMTADSVAIEDGNGNTPLHYAAIAGNTEIAKILVEKNPRLPQATNKQGETPVLRAAIGGHRETVSYLLSVILDDDPSPFAVQDGVRLLNSIMIHGFYDIAIDLLKRYPMLARGRNIKGQSALDRLAETPQAFASGNQLGCCQRLLYNCTRADTESAPRGGDVENLSRGSESNQNEYSKQFRFLEQMQNTVLMHKRAVQLLRLLISEVLKGNVSEADALLGPSTQKASTLGIKEFVIEVVKSYPSVVWLRNSDGHNIFHLAVKHRQEKIFNLLYQMGTHNLFVTSLVDHSDNNILHLAGKLEPSKKISGAALQMQRELQWFKEVEKAVQPSYKEMKNKALKSPRMVFTEEHKNLVEEGEKWMRDISTSYAKVAAFVVTVVFAAAFTAPGGNDSDQGMPVYLNETSFMIFAISDALGLLFSSTSLLMFLGILTSRYSEEDFLRALPMRLGIGLITLFFSIATMLVAFTAAFYLVLFHRLQWIAIPFGLVACVPIIIFAIFQFPLLVEIISSTFWPRVFRKQSQEIIF